MDEEKQGLFEEDPNLNVSPGAMRNQTLGLKYAGGKKNEKKKVERERTKEHQLRWRREAATIALCAHNQR